jgi:hypothetical protein
MPPVLAPNLQQRLQSQSRKRVRFSDQDDAFFCAARGVDQNDSLQDAHRNFEHRNLEYVDAVAIVHRTGPEGSTCKKAWLAQETQQSPGQQQQEQDAAGALSEALAAQAADHADEDLGGAAVSCSDSEPSTDPGVLSSSSSSDSDSDRDWSAGSSAAASASSDDSTCQRRGQPDTDGGSDHDASGKPSSRLRRTKAASSAGEHRELAAVKRSKYLSAATAERCQSIAAKTTAPIHEGRGVGSTCHSTLVRKSHHGWAAAAAAASPQQQLKQSSANTGPPRPSAKQQQQQQQQQQQSKASGASKLHIGAKPGEVSTDED